MTCVRVWAPSAQRVELECRALRREMKPAGSGWWEIDAADVVHGVEYAFRLDGEGPFPDPRSRWQPSGVQGPSCWVDFERFAWSDDGWQPPPLGSAILEEIHIGTFSPEGTFDGAIASLDPLVDLGVTHVELMPVAEFGGSRGWGYDGVDLYAPHHAYGGPEGLARFVDACHRKGLAVLLDVVYNHLGPSGNHLDRFGPYFTDAYATPWGAAINFDREHSDEVRRFFVDNALMWLRDYHIDGLRIDAVHAILDRSAVHFLEQLAREVRTLEASTGRHRVVIAESDLNDPRLVRSVEAGGYGLDAMWNEDFHHALHAWLTGERAGYYEDFGRVADVAKALTHGQVYDGIYSAHRKRHHGRSTADLPGRRFVGFLQNHDQIGNRARGERVNHLVSMGRLQIGAALVFTAPFVPLLFQGEEWGASTPFLYFTDHEDPELGEAVRQGRRREFAAFGWDPESVPDPQEVETFERSRLCWDERHRSPHREVLAWYASLVRLRRTRHELVDEGLHATSVRFDEDAGWLVVVRGALIVACNPTEVAQRIACPEARGKAVLLASQSGVLLERDAVTLPGSSVAILGPQ